MLQLTVIEEVALLPSFEGINNATSLLKCPKTASFDGWLWELRKKVLILCLQAGRPTARLVIGTIRKIFQATNIRTTGPNAVIAERYHIAQYEKSDIHDWFC